MCLLFVALCCCGRVDPPGEAAPLQLHPPNFDYPEQEKGPVHYTVCYKRQRRIIFFYLDRTYQDPIQGVTCVQSLNKSTCVKIGPLKHLKARSGALAVRPRTLSYLIPTNLSLYISTPKNQTETQNTSSVGCSRSGDCFMKLESGYVVYCTITSL